MENNFMATYLEKRFNLYIDVFEDIIDRCPDELWNKRSSGYIFWHQIIHALGGTYLFFRDEKINFFDGIADGINGLSINNELDAEPQDVIKELYTKNDLLNICNGTRTQCEKWFKGKNDAWLYLPFKMIDNLTNFSVTIGQLEHIMYHIGHCEAIFRANNIKTRKYLDDGEM